MSDPHTNQKSARENRKYWKVENILPTNNRRLQSYRFELHNERWVVYSYFCVSRWLLIRLLKLSNVTVHSFKVRAGLVHISGKEIISSSVKKVQKYYTPFEKLIYRSQLDSILNKKDVLYFFIEIRKNEETAVPKIQTDFEELLLTGQNSDVTILVKERRFNCHSIILGARSPVFKTMLERDKEEKRCAEITITDSEPAVFQEFLLYLYSGNKDHLDTDNYSSELYKLGVKYFIDDLKDLCVKRMIRNMPLENFFEIFLLSQQHNDTKLCTAAIRVLLEHSKEIVNSEEWKTFLCEYPGYTDVLIKSLDGVIPAEEKLEQTAPAAQITKA